MRLHIINKQWPDGSIDQCIGAIAKGDMVLCIENAAYNGQSQAFMDAFNDYSLNFLDVDCQARNVTPKHQISVEQWVAFSEECTDVCHWS